MCTCLLASVCTCIDARMYLYGYVCATGCVYVHVYYCILCTLCVCGGGLDRVCLLCQLKNQKVGTIWSKTGGREKSQGTQTESAGEGRHWRGLKKHMHTADTQRKTESQLSEDLKKNQKSSLFSRLGAFEASEDFPPRLRDWSVWRETGWLIGPQLLCDYV